MTPGADFTLAALEHRTSELLDAERELLQVTAELRTVREMLSAALDLLHVRDRAARADADRYERLLAEYRALREQLQGDARTAA